MKKTKKLLACLIAAATMFTMGSTAFAADTTPTDQETVTVKKVYMLTNEGTTSPAETFTLEQVGKGSVSDSEATTAPDLGTITGAEFAKGAATVDGTTGNITVALPAYDNVGIYEYTLREVAGTKAGVNYYGNDIKLKVTVVNGTNGKLRIAAVHTESTGKKSDSFVNTYSAGTLDISKTVEGNLGDKDKYFEFKVTLRGVEGKTYEESYAVTGGSEGASNPTSIKIGEETTFKLKHGDTISIKNLPYGVSYTVTETAAAGYTTTRNGDDSTVNAADQKVEFTNTRIGDVDTGVNLTTLPYILVFAGVIVIAGAAFITRRRKFED